MINNRTTHLNEISRNKHGTLMKIIEYKNTSNLVVEFQDANNYKTNSYYANFKIGQIKNPYDKIVYGVGYIGEGNYVARINKNKMSPAYCIWHTLILRCYNEKLRHKYPAYKNCIVCDEWHNYQIFADWYDQNYYDIGDGRMHVDKDILFKGNKTYSPDTCLIIPQRINMLFMKKNRNVDSDLPTGINRVINGNGFGFIASYNNKHLGTFAVLTDAIDAYNEEKKIHIKEVADEYQHQIPNKVYEALLNWL